VVVFNLNCLFLAYFLLLNFFCPFKVAILGGRPKNVPEEDMSARFFGLFRIGVTDFVNKFFYAGSFWRRVGSAFLLSERDSHISVKTICLNLSKEFHSLLPFYPILATQCYAQLV